jgi:hypothetical protein
MGVEAANWGRRLLIATVIVLIVAISYYGLKRVFMGPDKFTIDRTRPVVSGVDGMAYRVHSNHTGPEKAADALAKINSRVIDVLRYLRNRYLRGPDGDRYPQRRAAVVRLLARYNPDNLAENSPKDPSGDTAYSLDKGAIVAICLREKDPHDSGDPRVHDIHDFETLMFVTLHEMSHIAIDEIDHPPRFWSTFRWLLDDTELAGIYTSPNYAANPVRYCGIAVDYNPRYDSNTFPIM